jgi:hypothetical protein
MEICAMLVGNISETPKAESGTQKAENGIIALSFLLSAFCFL